MGKRSAVLGFREVLDDCSSLQCLCRTDRPRSRATASSPAARPFLLLPALAITLTARWDLVLAAWFVAHAALFVAAYVALAHRVGGRSGSIALWLLPAVALSFPVVYNFQFGQFHLAAVSLAVLAMLAFARGRRAVGGALLAVAILAKVFPAVLLGYLAGRRRWCELAAVAVAGALLTASAVGVFGLLALYAGALLAANRPPGHSSLERSSAVWRSPENA